MIPLNLFTHATAKLYGGIALAALLGAGLQTCRLDREKTAHTQTIERTKAAQQVAAARQAATDQRAFDLNTRLSENADVLSQLASRDTIAAVDRYARAHPVRLRCEAPGGAASGAGVAGLSGDPGSVPDPPTTPDMVAIPRDEVDKLAEGAVQGARKTIFLKSLVEAGVAIPQSKLDQMLPQPALPTGN